jgi:hypothetical protein
MHEVAVATPPLEGKARERFEAAFAVTRQPAVPHDAAAARAELQRLVARGA